MSWAANNPNLPALAGDSIRSASDVQSEQSEAIILLEGTDKGGESVQNYNEAKETNRIYRVNSWGGIIGGLADSTLKELSDAGCRANQDGYEFIQVIPDGTNIIRNLMNLIILCLTLGFWCPLPGYLVIARKIDAVRGVGDAGRVGGGGSYRQVANPPYRATGSGRQIDLPEPSGAVMSRASSTGLACSRCRFIELSENGARCVSTSLELSNPLLTTCSDFQKKE